MSERLRFLLSKAQPGEPLWDIGCDHGYLAEGALRSGLFPEVHFVDPVAELVDQAESRVLRRFPLTNGERGPAFFHRCKGEDLAFPVRGSVVIAGMGGLRICSILRTWQSSGVLRASRLILSPHRDEGAVLHLLSSLPGARVLPRETVSERGRARVALVALFSA